MSKADEAAKIFDNDFNCCQAVLSVLAPDHGLDMAGAQRIATAFGGGMGRMGEVCGAVVGAFMALGLKYGDPESNNEAKEKAYQAVNEFAGRFRAIHDSILCRELLGCDIGTPEGMAEAKERRLFDTLCVDIVRNSVKIAEEL